MYVILLGNGTGLKDPTLPRLPPRPFAPSEAEPSLTYAVCGWLFAPLILPSALSPIFTGFYVLFIGLSRVSPVFTDFSFCPQLLGSYSWLP